MSLGQRITQQNVKIYDRNPRAGSTDLVHGERDREYSREIQCSVSSRLIYVPTPESPTDLPVTSSLPKSDPVTHEPTLAPTDESTPAPTDEATPAPTDEATPSPTDEATPAPTDEATPAPTDEATPEPTDEATPSPTDEATPAPTDEATPSPTDEATPAPTDEATPAPTDEPTPSPVTLDEGKSNAGPTANAQESMDYLVGAPRPKRNKTKSSDHPLLDENGGEDSGVTSVWSLLTLDPCSHARIPNSPARAFVTPQNTSQTR